MFGNELQKWRKHKKSSCSTTDGDKSLLCIIICQQLPSQPHPGARFVDNVENWYEVAMFPTRKWLYTRYYLISNLRLLEVVTFYPISIALKEYNLFTDFIDLMRAEATAEDTATRTTTRTISVYRGAEREGCISTSVTKTTRVRGEKEAPSVSTSSRTRSRWRSSSTVRWTRSWGGSGSAED